MLRKKVSYCGAGKRNAGRASEWRKSTPHWTGHTSIPFRLRRLAGSHGPIDRGASRKPGHVTPKNRCDMQESMSFIGSRPCWLSVARTPTFERADPYTERLAAISRASVVRPDRSAAAAQVLAKTSLAFPRSRNDSGSMGLNPRRWHRSRRTESHAAKSVMAESQGDVGLSLPKNSARQKQAASRGSAKSINARNLSGSWPDKLPLSTVATTALLALHAHGRV